MRVIVPGFGGRPLHGWRQPRSHGRPLGVQRSPGSVPPPPSCADGEIARDRAARGSRMRPDHGRRGAAFVMRSPTSATKHAGHVSRRSEPRGGRLFNPPDRAAHFPQRTCTAGRTGRRSTSGVPVLTATSPEPGSGSRPHLRRARYQRSARPSAANLTLMVLPPTRDFNRPARRRSTTSTTLGHPRATRRRAAVPATSCCMRACVVQSGRQIRAAPPM